MRTTLVLGDDVIREAKRRAAELDVTLGEFVTRAIRDALRARPPENEPPFQMITYGGPGPRVHNEPGDLKAAMEAEDARALKRK